MKKTMRVITKLLIALFFLGACAVIIYDAVTGKKFLSAVNGWWTFFLIIPGIMGLFSRGSRLGSVGLILLGGMLLVRENAESWLAAYPDIAERVSQISWLTLAAAVLLFVIALAILGSLFGVRKHVSVNVSSGNTSAGKKGVKEYSAVFSELKQSYTGKQFKGAELNGIFSTVELDLTGAIIEQDCVIDANAVFGGVVIRTDPSYNVKVTGNQVFGSVSNVERENIEGAPTVTVEANAVFGGVEVK